MPSKNTIELAELEQLIKTEDIDTLSGKVYTLSGVARGVDVRHALPSIDGEASIACYLEQPNDKYAQLSFQVPSYMATSVATSLKTSGETNKPIVVEALFQGGSIENKNNPALNFLVYEMNFHNHTYNLKDE